MSQVVRLIPELFEEEQTREYSGHRLWRDLWNKMSDFQPVVLFHASVDPLQYAIFVGQAGRQWQNLRCDSKQL